MLVVPGACHGFGIRLNLVYQEEFNEGLRCRDESRPNWLDAVSELYLSKVTKLLHESVQVISLEALIRIRRVAASS